MSKSPFLACLYAALTLATLVGCGGGGGGGGGSGGGGGDTPVVYDGNTNAAVITTTNASKLTANIIGGSDTTGTIGGVSVANGDATQNQNSGLINFARRLNRSVHDSVLHAGQASSAQRLLTGLIQIEQTDPCDSGSVRTFGTLNDDGTGELQVSYNSCLTDGITVNGSATLRVDAAQVTFIVVPTDSTLSFTRLTFRGPGLSIDSTGSLQTLLPIGSNTETTTEKLVSQDNINMGKKTKTDLVFVDVYDNISFPTSVTTSVSGKVFDHEHGFVDISTNAPLIFGTLTQLFPGSGQLLLAGAMEGTGNRRILVTALSSVLVKVELDLDGNGAYENSAILKWTDLSGPVGADLADRDGDGMHNSWETANQLDPENAADAALDSDGDGASNLAEYQAGTDPRSSGSVPPVVSPPGPAPGPAPGPPPPAGTWQPAPGSTPTSGNYIYLESDPGDFIGLGRTYTYTQSNALLTVIASGGNLFLGVAGDEDWTGNFQSPSSLSMLQPGLYDGLQRFPFHDPVKGGLSWSGEGRGCNTLTGWFVIDSVTYTNGALTAVELRFEQHCEGGAPALRGKIHWEANDPTSPPGPVNPPPAGLWQPAPGSTPASGNYVYLQSDPGDFIGVGQTNTYTQANAQISVGASGGLLSVSVAGTHNWSGDFRTMSSLSVLQPGLYDGLQRYPFHNPVKGGLSWSGQGRGCNTLTGWFVVDSVTYTNNVLTAVDLRFEQHCEGGAAALHGQIHWTQ